jgi:hypothetical protein
MCTNDDCQIISKFIAAFCNATQPLNGGQLNTFSIVIQATTTMAQDWMAVHQALLDLTNIPQFNPAAAWDNYRVTTIVNDGKSPFAPGTLLICLARRQNRYCRIFRTRQR